jgi:lauroyl/myristoyl acyltransferase
VILSQLLKGVSLWIFFYPLRWTAQRLSWRLALKVGALLGSVHALCISDQFQRRIREGLQAVWPDELPVGELNRLVRCNLITRYKHLIDGFFYQRLDEVLIQRMVPTIEGRTYLDAELSGGRGVILLLSHFGSFGMLIGGLVLRGYRLHQIFTLSPPPPYRTWRWVERAIMKAKLSCWAHARLGCTFWRPGMYLRPLYRRLLAGDLLVMYGDGARGHGFTRVPFMGYPLSLSTGPFRIAAKTHVPLIPAFIIREADDTHRIILEQPIMLNDDTPGGIQQGACQYASLLAHYIRTYPDHWFTWARLRWTSKHGSRWLELTPGDTTVEEFYSIHASPIGRR